MANYRFEPKTLAPLKTSPPFKKVAIIDLETDKWIDDTYGKSQRELSEWHDKPIPVFLATFYNGKDEPIHYEGKDCVRKFLREFLVFKNREYVCFAHNGGKFDFLPMLLDLLNEPEFNKRFWVKPISVHSRILAITIHDYKKHTWHLRDSYPLLLSSLKDLSESFKPLHRKLEMPDPPEGITASTWYETHKEEYQKYCDNDCYCLYEIMQMFIRVIQDVGGCIGNTAASTAMKTFRRKFLHQEIPTYFAYNNMLRNAFYGGRTEVFQMYAMETGHPYYYYDINSQYPWVMANNIFPVTYPKRVNIDPVDCKGRCGVMECDIIAPPDLHIPLLPYKNPLNHKLIFPLGRWSGWYEFGFIEKALEYGYHITPHRTYEFEGDYLFREYVEQFYKLKCETDGAFRNIMKILLNSLYGKFAEHEEQEELIMDPDEDIEGAYLIDDVFGFFVKKVYRRRAHQLLGIAARVTTMAQLKLYSYFEVIQRLGGTIIYCDTDSIITDVRIPTGTELGGVKLEAEFVEGVFLAPKTYCLRTYDTDNEYKMVMKGFSRDFRKHITMEEFRNALPPKNDFSPFIDHVVHPASFKQIRTRHLGGFVTMLETKSIKEVYDKRRINDDLTTTPWELPFPEKPPKVYPFKSSHPDMSRRMKKQKLMSPQSINERELLDRLHRRHGYPRDTLMRCINLARDTDFDFEHEVDWDTGDPEGQIRKKLHYMDDDDFRWFQTV